PQLWPNTINQANKVALLAWAKATGITLVQINGQRRYGGPPPGWVGSPPRAGSEVFIGRLPQDMYEHELIPLFQSVGKLYEFRLMMTFSGLNRGFAYARYSSRRGASQAIATLHNREVRRGCAILVCRSTEKCELSLDGLGPALGRPQLEAALRRLTQGLLSVALYPSPFRERCQLALLRYSSHHAAAMAKKTLVEGNPRLVGMEMNVDWLKSDLKQRLQSCEESAAPGQEQEAECPAVPLAAVPLAPVPRDALARLNTLCQRWRLGTPLFLTKCVQVAPSGWLRFWCQVAIPGCPLAFSGFVWVWQDRPGSSGHKQAKVAVALHLLQRLGESSLRAPPPEPWATPRLPAAPHKRCRPPARRPGGCRVPLRTRLRPGVAPPAANQAPGLVPAPPNRVESYPGSAL
ncbi:dead end protein homolog 1, partial [Indicator indicator]|uniref:dead end protein homolog 1 n=1 Tax=Indicator indicator TaxID=1002788 RepID=UPI0023DED81E